MAGTKEQWQRSASDLFRELASSYSMGRYAGTPMSITGGNRGRPSSITAAPTHSSWITNPEAAIAEMMTAFPEGITETAQYEEMANTPASGAVPPAPPELSPISDIAPEGISEETILGKYADMEKAIQGLSPPAERTAPGEVDPWKEFAAVLAGSFASQISRRPELLEVATRNIEKLRERRQQILEQNFANKMLFDKEQQNRVVSVRLSALNTLLDKAIKDNDAEKAAHYAERIQKMQENARKEETRYEQESMNYRQERALEASKEEKKLELDAKTAEANAKASKPLEMKDYNSQQLEISSKKIDDLKERIHVPGWFDTETDIQKRDLFLLHDAAAAIGGTDEVKAVATARFVTRLKQRLNIKKEFTEFNDNEAESFFKGMIKYGVPQNIAVLYMQQQGIEVGE